MMSFREPPAQVFDAICQPKTLRAQARVVARQGLRPKYPVSATKEALEQAGGNVMIVGHWPFLGRLVALLVTGREELGIVGFQYGGVVCLERRAGESWQIGWMITPRLLQYAEDRP